MPMLWVSCLQGTEQHPSAFPVVFGCSSSLQNQRGATGVGQQGTCWEHGREHSISGAAAQRMDTAPSTCPVPSGTCLAPVSPMLVSRCYNQPGEAGPGWAGGKTRDGAALRRTDHDAFLDGRSPSAPVPWSVPFNKYNLSPLDLSSPRKLKPC